MFCNECVHKGRMSCSSRSYIKKLLVETVAHVFSHISFLGSHSPNYYIKKLLKEKALEMIPKYGRTDARGWP